MKRKPPIAQRVDELKALLERLRRASDPQPELL